MAYKVQSYLACWKPIIGALDGEGAHIIESSGAGYAVAAEDAQALADAVLKMYRHFLSSARRAAGVRHLGSANRRDGVNYPPS